MPRVNSGKTAEMERREATRKIIRKAMIEYGYKSSEPLAEKIGKSKSWVNNKIRNGEWKLHEIAVLNNCLHFSQEDAAVMAGVKRP